MVLFEQRLFLLGITKCNVSRLQAQPFEQLNFAMISFVGHILNGVVEGISYGWMCIVDTRTRVRVRVSTYAGACFSSHTNVLLK